MEEILTADERIVLHAQCAAARVPIDRWHLCKGIARPWELLVCMRLARIIHSFEGITESHAFEEAAARLHLSSDTLTSRRKDWPKSAYGSGRRYKKGEISP